MLTFRVEVENQKLGEWVAFIGATHHAVTAASRSEMETAVWEYLSQVAKTNTFIIEWIG